MSRRLSSYLLVHDDSELLDALTHLFEARGCAVAIAATAFAARARFEAGKDYDVVVAGWESARAPGAELYRWILEHRYAMRDRFVFLAAELPDDFGEFDRIVRGRCLLLDAYDWDEIARVGEGIARRSRIQDSRSPFFDMSSQFDPARPSLLLVEDEPLQLVVMRTALARAGFSVTSVDCGKAAMAELERADYDVILCDWYMANGSGSDLYQWLLAHRPHMGRRCVFMSAANPREHAHEAPGCPFLAKGQDSSVLFHKLETIAALAS